MLRQYKKLITLIIVVVVIGLGANFIIRSRQAGGSVEALDPKTEFAQCLSDKGARFFGAFWCPHCQNQKILFGIKASKKLPYVECSNNDRSQKQICVDENIEGYPTWKFADGGVENGELSFEELSAKTGCSIPN